MKLIIITLLLISYSVSYAGKNESVSHSHNGRTHSHPLPETGKNHTHNSGGQKNESKTKDEFEWLNRSGWVTMYQLCRVKKKFNPEKYKSTNCKNYRMNPVTEKSMFSSWAGEPLKVFYDKDQDNFTGNLQIKVTWTTEGKYNCGQMIEKYQSELKDFTHRSIKMKKCS